MLKAFLSRGMTGQECSRKINLEVVKEKGQAVGSNEDLDSYLGCGDRYTGANPRDTLKDYLDIPAIKSLSLNNHPKETLSSRRHRYHHLGNVELFVIQKVKERARNDSVKGKQRGLGCQQRSRDTELDRCSGESMSAVSCVLP